ncbi:hypothetical protein PFISCL1PPCAC_13590, partial [Pristionchus fissidentatus]
IASGVINGYYLALVALFPNPFYCLLFRKMLHRNEAHFGRLSELRGKDLHDAYSLSIRVQLKENIWTMQKIEYAMYALTTVLAADLLFVFVPSLSLDRQEDLPALQWFTVAANLVVAMCLFAALSMAFHSDLLPITLRRYIRK